MLKKSDILKEIKDGDDWVVYKGLKVHKYYDAIKDMEDDVLIGYKKIRGLSRKDFIAEAIEHNDSNVDYKIPSFGSGNVYHIMNKEDFKPGLENYLYDSPLNLKRLDDEGYILYIGLNRNKIQLIRFDTPRQVAEYFNLNPCYVRQVLRRGESRFKDGYLVKTFQDEFKELKMTDDEFKVCVSNNIREMEERGWLV